MKFEKALEVLRQGYKARCSSWDEAVYIFINSKGKLTGVNAMGHWACTLDGEDILAEDWMVVE